jgi:MYXO-CTERM domain-containing protein
MRIGPTVLATAIWALPAAAWAEDFYVDAAAGPGGDGTMAAPFVEIQEALDVAAAGDVIHVLPGTYAPIATVVDGTGAAPITVQGEPAGDAIVQADGTALEAHHEYHTFEGLVFDGGYGAGDAIDGDGANFLELFDVEVRRSGRDCIDLHTVEGVLIANSRIHHCVAGEAGMPTDAHGVTGDSVLGLEIRDTEIYLFSGDAVQMSPPRLAWDDLQIRRCVLWSGALDEDAGPITRGTIIGENALDTKVGPDLDGEGNLPRVEIEDTIAYGFRGFIDNQAAFNLKEDVDVLVDRVTVYDSELAFRLRGPALVRVQNAVVHGVDGAVRYEDGLPGAAILASTFGGDVGASFIDGGGDPPVDLLVENLLVLGDAVPDEAAAGTANLAVGPEVFVDAAAHDYYLVEGSGPVDAGAAIDGVTLDRDGTFRPVGDAFDVGAYEWDPAGPPPPDDTGGGVDESGGGEGSSGGSSGPAGMTGGSETSEPDGTGTGTGPGATGLDMDGGTVSGCGCRSPGPGAGALALLGLMAGLRRRRSPRPRATAVG